MRDTLAKGAGRISAENAGGAEARPWIEGHSDPQGDSLLEKVVETENMRRVWKQVRRNKGAAGVDGRDIGETLAFLRTNWSDIRRQLLEGIHTPYSIKQFHDTFVNAETTATGILRYSDAILAKLSRDLPDLVGNPGLHRKLQEKIVALSTEISEAKASVKQKLDGEAVWQQYLELHPFHMGLHGTMRLVYLAVYGAYENFVVRSLSIAHGGKRIRVTDREFNKDYRAAFGDLGGFHVDESFNGRPQSESLKRDRVPGSSGTVRTLLTPNA